MYKILINNFLKIEQYIILQNFSLFTVLYLLFLYLSKFYLLNQNDVLFA